MTPQIYELWEYLCEENMELLWGLYVGSALDPHGLRKLRLQLGCLRGWSKA